MQLLCYRVGRLLDCVVWPIQHSNPSYTYPEHIFLYCNHDGLAPPYIAKQKVLPKAVFPLPSNSRAVDFPGAPVVRRNLPLNLSQALLHRSLRRNAQLKSSCSASTIAQQLVNIIITASLSMPRLCMHCQSHIVDCRLSIAHCRLWIVDCSLSKIGPCGSP